MRSIDDVLQQVAAGELTPDEALSLLGGTGSTATDDPVDTPASDEASAPDPGIGSVRLDKPAGDQEPPTDPPGPPPLPPPPAGPGRTAARAAVGAGSPVRILKFRALANAVEIYGDPAVAEAQVTCGSPQLRRDGDTLYVERRSARGGGGSYTFLGSLPRKLASIPGFDERIVLRVNPALLVDLDASAVSIRVWGIEGGLRLRLGASSAKLDRVNGPLVIDAHSSSIKGSVMLAAGEHHIRCESCSVKLGLLAGSDVRIDASNSLGKVVLPSSRSRSGSQTARAQASVGRGAGHLSVHATMSSVSIGRSW